MEGDNLQAKPSGDAGDGLDVGPVGIPMFIRHDAAGFFDGVERRVIFSDGAEHAGDDFDAFGGEQLGGFAPCHGVFAERIERKLDARDADLAEMGDECLGGFRLQRPTANRQPGFDVVCHFVGER